MSDPAVEAAQSALDQRPWFGYGEEEQLALIAAREVLKPIRELIEHRLGVGACEVFLEDLMPLVYPESEMPDEW